MYIVTNSYQTIWDLAYKYYGDYNAVGQLILDNPDKLNLDDEVQPGWLIKITDFVAPIVADDEAEKEHVFVPYYEVSKINQSLWDLALQYYGTYDAVKQLLLDNPKLDFSNAIQPGTLVYVTQKPILKKMVDFLTNKGYKPSTGIAIVSNWILANGIWEDSGVWVDSDFWND